MLITKSDVLSLAGCLISKSIPSSAKYAPELENKKAMIIESQKYLATQYASDKDKWGYIDQLVGMLFITG